CSPVDITDADADGVFDYFKLDHSSPGVMKVTFSSPHWLTSGMRPELSVPGDPLPWASNGTGTPPWPLDVPGYTYLLPHPTDPTHSVLMRLLPGSGNPRPPWPTTLGAVHTAPGNLTVTVNGAKTPQNLVELCNDLGVDPHINVS